MLDNECGGENQNNSSVNQTGRSSLRRDTQPPVSGDRFCEVSRMELVKKIYEIGIQMVRVARRKRNQGKYFKTERGREKKRELANRAYRNNPTERKKIICRARTQTALNSGKIQADRCSVCDATEHLEKHHPDYTNPYDIIIFCVSCHRKHHAESKVFHFGNR